MNQEDAFLDSILDDPDDDAPRLVYADWLEDHGEPERAAFIRAGCRLAVLDEDDPACLPLWRDVWAYLPRAEEALAAAERPARLARLSRHRAAVEFIGVAAAERPAWLARLPARIPHGLRFVRGFPGCWTTTAKRFVEKAAALMQGAPIQHARLTNVAPSAGPLARCESLARLRSLDLSGNRMPPDAMRALADSPHLAGLRQLRWQHGQLTAEKAAALATAPWLAGVRDLDLYGNSFGDGGAGALAASPHLRELEVLDVGHCGIGPRGGQAVVDSAHLGRLRKLRLSDNRLGDAGAEALARSERLGGLSSLDVAYCKVGLEGVQALLNPPGLSALSRLRLGESTWPTAAWSIEPAERLRGGITVCLLDGAYLVVHPMAGSPLLASCRGLEVGGNLGDEGVRILAESPAIRGLEVLRLGWCPIIAAGGRALAASPHLGALRELQLTAENDALDALLEAPYLTRLTRLDVSFRGENTEALRRLARSPAARDGIVWVGVIAYGDWRDNYGWWEQDRAETLQELRERLGPRLRIE